MIGSVFNRKHKPETDLKASHPRVHFIISSFVSLGSDKWLSGPSQVIRAWYACVLGHVAYPCVCFFFFFFSLWIWYPDAFFYFIFLPVPSDAVMALDGHQSSWEVSSCVFLEV